MQVADNLLKGEENSGDRRIEGGGERSSTADRDQRFHLFFAEAESSAEDRGNSRPDLDRGTLPAQRDAGGEGRRATEEFPHHGPQRDPAVLDVQCGFRLRDAAAASIREIPEEQVPGHQRPEYRKYDAAPLMAIGRVEVGRQAAGDQDECHDYQSDDGPDDEAQDQRHLRFVPPELVHPPEGLGGPVPEHWHAKAILWRAVLPMKQRCCKYSNVALCLPLAGVAVAPSDE